MPATLDSTSGELSQARITVGLLGLLLAVQAGEVPTAAACTILEMDTDRLDACRRDAIAAALRLVASWRERVYD